MEGGGESDARLIVYCLVPPALAGKLHEPLRRHFADDPNVQVVVERRGGDRRTAAARRAAEAAPPATDRRAIRNPSGRRVGDRRAATVAVPAPPLPRRARAFADQLVFAEVVAPSTEQREDLDSARLVTRFQAGERDAFGELYIRYFDRVYGYLRVALNDSHAAEDVTQQVFMQVMEALPRYERRSGALFRAWLFTVVRNEARKELIKRGRSDVLDPVDLERRRPAEAVAEDEDLHALQWISDEELLMFIERLPAVQRQVLVLRYMLDLSYTEIAQVLDRTVVDIRTLHSRGVRFLRARLESLGRVSTSRQRTRMRGCLRRAPVLGARRWALQR